MHFILITLLSVLIGTSAYAQDFVDKEYYLVDSLTISGMNKEDSTSLHEMLIQYHGESEDIMRLEILSDLSDVYGPRLTGSDMYYRAAEWTKEKMEGWKLDNVHYERFCQECRGWEVN